MNNIFTFLLAVGFGVYVFYIEKIERPKWESQTVVEAKPLEGDVVEVRSRKTPKTSQSPVEKVEVSKTLSETPRLGEVADNSIQIGNLEASRDRDEERYQALKAELQTQIERGREAVRRVANEDAPFNSRSRIKTSEADQKAWHNDHMERVNAVKSELGAVEARLSELESAWRDLKANYASKIRDLK